MDRIASNHFSLTFKAVICKQHLAVCSNQVSSFNPKRGKEDFKWSMVAQKPRYSEEIESGVLCFVAQISN